MAAAPTILDAPQLAVSTDLNDVTWLRACELRGRLTILIQSQDGAGTDGPHLPLCEWLNAKIEAHLLCVGASPGTVNANSDAHAQLYDQVYRARLLGYAGLAVSLGSLRRFSVSNTLSTVDSWALLDFCKAAEALQVDVRFAAADSSLLLIPAPVAFGQLGVASFAEPGLKSKPAPVATPELSSTPSGVVPANRSAAAKEREPSSTTSGRSMRVAMQDLLKDELGCLDDMVTPVPQASVRGTATSSNERAKGVVDLRALEAYVDSEPAPAVSLTAVTAADSGASPAAADSEDAPLENPPVAVAPVDSASRSIDAAESLAAQPAPSLTSAPAKPVASVALGTITPTPQPVPVAEAASAVRVETLIRELQTTDGTCGWEEIEQRFSDSYLPLQQLLPTLANPAAALQALSDWASAFADSYRAAFEALRNNRGKRPRLVLDVPSHAFQLSRKLELEQYKMVLVDAMRADLAPIVLDKLRLQMTHTAECVAEGLAWSALPSTTAAQMELIARGTDSLRHYTGELAEEQLLSRGNDLRRLRPVRIGSHRMYKLDIVQYLTRDTTTHERSKLEQYAAEIATSVGRFLRQQGPNTLVYVFGDHGFGGACEASPENVLVPYFAWRLLG